ncbi:hypothetical protein C8R48DRAFT_678303 [Suillus tomentosus]|nr:hypothetical protein C8R48DRAFT_678303 [Suillus tomentosus]
MGWTGGQMNEQRAQPHKISRGVHIGIGTGMGLTFKTRDPCTRVALSLAIPAWAMRELQGTSAGDTETQGKRWPCARDAPKSFAACSSVLLPPLATLHPTLHLVLPVSSLLQLFWRPPVSSAYV